MQAKATHHQYGAEELNDLNKEIAELINTILNIIKSIYNSDSQSMSAILR